MGENKNLVDLGTKNIGKLLSKYAIPAIIAMVAASLYNITDSVFIGHGVGALAISGLAITFPLMNLAVAFNSLIGVGASTLLSVRLGQKDYKTANNILGNVFIMSIVAGILFSIIALLYLNPILIFFGASKNTLPYAHDFMKIILFGNVITYMYFGLNSILRSSGHPNRAMYATIFTVIINLILNPLFIFGFNWGIKGSALATVISQIIVLIWQIYLFTDKREVVRLQSGIFKVNLKVIKDSLKIGMSPFLMNVAGCIIVVLVNQGLLKYGGDLEVGAYGIINRVSFLFVMVCLGLNQAMQPIAGYNYGAKLHHRVNEVLKKTIIGATIIMTIGFVLVELFPYLVSSVFTNDSVLTEMSAIGLRFVFLCFPIVGFQIVVSTFFQSIGIVKKAVFLSLTRQIIFLIPFLLILPNFLGVNGIWISMPLADFASTIVAAFMLYFHFRKENKKNASLIVN